LTVVLAAPSFGKADVFNVREAGDVDRLIRVIKRANANNEAETINLAAGRYTLMKADNRGRFRMEANGLPVIKTKITINGAVFTGDGTRRSTIERQTGVEEFRILDVAKRGNLTLNRMRIQGGRVPDDGGGIINAGRLRLVRTIVRNNESVNESGAA